MDSKIGRKLLSGGLVDYLMPKFGLFKAYYRREKFFKRIEV